MSHSRAEYGNSKSNIRREVGPDVLHWLPSGLGCHSGGVQATASKAKGLQSKRLTAHLSASLCSKLWCAVAPGTQFRKSQAHPLAFMGTLFALLSSACTGGLTLAIGGTG
eukprot:1159179-Pelagomonas_calceolata.AAC.4